MLNVFLRKYLCKLSGKAIEFMLCDALAEADPVLGISKTVENPEEYLQLNDTILNQIEFSKEPVYYS
jgi:hypothetical protein